MSDEAITLTPVKRVFESDFQGMVATLCLKDTVFLGQVDGLVKPEYFDNIDTAIAVDIAQRYFGRYKKAFGDFRTFCHFAKELTEKKQLRSEDLKGSLLAIRSLWDSEVSDRQFVVDGVSNFARHQAVENALCEIAEKHIETGNFDVIQTLMTKALQVGAFSEHVGYDYGAGIESRTDERVAKAKGEVPADTITTGYPQLDEFLPDGGWGRKEMAVLMGRAKVGKSTALMDFAIRACGCAMRYNVLYVTLEVSQKVIAKRADANISGIQIKFVDASSQSVKEAVRKWRESAGKFVIEEFPTGTLRVSDLRRCIDRWKSSGVVFDLVVVDYADLMIPERDTSNAQENSRRVWTDLRGLASAEGFALLTATQTNREGAKKITAGMTDVAEDFNKIRIADIVISINKTEEEVLMNECRLSWVAARNGEQDFSVRIRQNISCMRFVTEVVGVE